MRTRILHNACSFETSKKRRQMDDERKGERLKQKQGRGRHLTISPMEPCKWNITENYNTVSTRVSTEELRWCQVSALAICSVKPWSNGLASSRKLKTWVYLRLRLARPCVHLRWLAITLVEIKFAHKSKQVFYRLVTQRKSLRKFNLPLLASPFDQGLMRCCLSDYVEGMCSNACSTCSTNIFPHSTNHIIDLWQCLCRCAPCFVSVWMRDWT